MNKKPKRANRRWTDEEKQALREFVGEYDDRQIGILLDRKTGAIKAMRAELGIPGNRKEAVVEDQLSIHPAVLAVVNAREKYASDLDEAMTSPGVWNEAHHEMFKAAVRVWLEGRWQEAIGHLCWMGMTKLTAASSREEMKAEMYRLISEVEEWRDRSEDESSRRHGAISRFVRSDNSSDVFVVCPECGQVCTSMCEVKVVQKTQVTEVTRDTTHVLPGREGALGRGSSVMILFECEEGHFFLFSLNFHKGTTYLEAGEVGLENPDQKPTHLWRD